MILFYIGVLFLAASGVSLWYSVRLFRHTPPLPFMEDVAIRQQQDKYL